ncbi:helicase-associated domain-containing protein [Microbacterium terricola]|uniref:Helicase XPB/Ssl2 N-terminal domain-containing protein n=1 Tax=Microbacterium terricola TaxID=344163 RepID=A0ABM8E047_9MICO|nr:helicase-associated domain-containing protein [Microbacterium terricola]UYK40952.1 helicase-associated domain-containing protein [Microbacterium terricola]BDV31294.1 hypothetical protein Microterr_19540 [Microbacterium terricola]
MVSDERALATWLSGQDDVALACTLAERGMSPAAPWRDFFDTAAALLDAPSVDRALARLPRTALRSLADGTASSPATTRLALADETGAPYAAVALRLAVARQTRPDAFTPTDEPTEPPLADDEHAAAAAERAFTTTGALADVLLAASHLPLVRTGAGPVSAVDRRRLVEAGAVSTPDELDDLIESAAIAGLLSPTEREWRVTPEGEAWLQSSTSERWRVVVEALRDGAPDGVRTPSGEILPVGSWVAAYPLRTDWPAFAAQQRTIATRWGLLTDDAAEPEWTRTLRTGAPLDTGMLSAHLPAEIDRVYLQADLTAIAPGPLVPALDLRLRGLARRESRAQASTYRFSADTIGAGMTEGETAGSIRAFLASLSLTGIPQPLEYLIQSTAARHGQVRVRADEVSGRTEVTSADSGLRETIAVDQALRALGLIPVGDALLSRVSRDSVYWALADARYPVVALDPDGEPEALHRRVAPGSGAPIPTPVELYGPLIERLRGGDDADTDAAWLTRELEQAVRSRSVIVVAVRMPDGAERAFTVEATGLGGGRLRGRDRAADVERTLPVSSIVAVRPVP